jgi:hypothetical protein
MVRCAIAAPIGPYKCCGTKWEYFSIQVMAAFGFTAEALDALGDTPYFAL